MFHVEHSNPQHIFLETFAKEVKQFGFCFSNEALGKFSSYYDELCRWDCSVNLTGLQTNKERTVLLFVDSLAGSLALGGKKDGCIADIGTGGGFPGIPLKLALPEIKLVLIEPRKRKIAFLHNIIGKLDLSHTTVIQSRIEELHKKFIDEEKCDVAFSKAVNIEHILPHAKNIVKKDGKLVVFRARNIDNHDIIKGMELDQEIPYELPYGYGKRVLLVMRM